MKNRLFLFASLIALLMAPPAMAGEKSFWGTAVGASLGGWLGSTIGKGSGQLAATGAGVFLGGLMGNSVGSSLDRADASYASSRGHFYESSAYSIYPQYEPNYVAPAAPPPPEIIYVEPVVEYRPARPVYIEEGFVGPSPPPPSGRYCREFTQTIRIDGEVHESYGTACLRPDGSWQIQQ